MTATKLSDKHHSDGFPPVLLTCIWH